MSTAVTEQAWCVVVPHHARGARVARHRLAGELASLLPPAKLADVVTVVAELVGNAVRHAEPLPGGVMRVAWVLRPTPRGLQVEVRVTDGGSPGLPSTRTVDTDSSDGRGLTIVEALADRWGVRRDGLGQTVWARLSAPAPARQGIPGGGCATPTVPAPTRPNASPVGGPARHHGGQAAPLPNAHPIPVPPHASSPSVPAPPHPNAHPVPAPPYPHALAISATPHPNAPPIPAPSRPNANRPAATARPNPREPAAAARLNQREPAAEPVAETITEAVAKAAAEAERGWLHAV